MTKLLTPVFIPINLWDEPTAEPSCLTNTSQSLCVPAQDIVFPGVASLPSNNGNRLTIAGHRPPLPRLNPTEQHNLLVKSDGLRNFFYLFFESSQRIHFFPMMRPEVLEQQRLNPDFPEFIGRKQVRQGDYITSRFREGLSVCLGSSRFSSAIRLLEEFNRQGYDIYWCVNPLVCNRRLKCAVRKIITLVIESDLNTFEEQILAEKALKGHIRASVFTGNKSLHNLIRIEPSIWNPHCITDWRMIRRYDSDRSPRIRLPEFESGIEEWQNLLTARGFYVDWNVLSDFSRLSRVPGFVNHKTGKRAELRTVNENAWWVPGSRIYWEESVGRDVSCGTGPVDQAVLSSNGVGHGVGIVSPVGAPVDLVNFEAPVTAGTIGECCVCYTVKTNHTIKPPPEPHRRCVLDSLDVYESMRRHGIPGRGKRRELHSDLFAVARVFDWDGERLAAEWRKIVGIRPANIGCSTEQAVQDILRHWQRAKKPQPWLPDTGQLPDLTTARVTTLKSNLKRHGCPAASSCARIIGEILYPLVLRLPRQCAQGEISIVSRDLQNKCVSKRSKLPMQWLHSWNILRITDQNYIRAKRTKRYFVNVAVVVWLLGIRD